MLKALMESQGSNIQLIIRLLRYAWQFRWRCLLVIALQSIILILTIGGINLLGLAIDYLKAQVLGRGEVQWPFGLAVPTGVDPLHVVLGIGGAIVLLALIRVVVEYYNEYVRGLLVHVDIVLHLRSQVYEKMQKLSFRFFDRNASGTLINRVTGDVQAVRLFIDQVVVQVFIMIVSLAVYLSYMLSYHVLLTLACLVTTPFLWAISVYFSKLLHPAYMRHRSLMDGLILGFSQSMEGIQTVKAFGLEEQRRAAFARDNRAVKTQRQGIFWMVSTLGPSVGMLTQINLVILLAYGGTLVMRGELPLGAGLVAFAALLQQFSNQIANLANIADSIQQSLTGARRVFEVLDAPLEVSDPPRPQTLATVRGAVHFENVWFEYRPKNIILKRLEFEAKPGEIIAIAGATGSGKSAMMSLIPRFYDPIRGRVRLDGVDLRDLKLEAVRRSIGIVFQENFLFSNSIAANIAFGNPHATRAQIERAAQIACADGFIRERQSGYDSLLEEGGLNLSGGQRQRLAIARAVLLEPPILLLDDPTAAIDPETEHEILEAIDRAIEGRTTFIVAHRLSTLKRADRILVLDHGAIVQSGTHKTLMAEDGLYRRAVEVQAVDPDSLRILARQYRTEKGGDNAHR